jgi:hypothetical protein
VEEPAVAAVVVVVDAAGDVRRCPFVAPAPVDLAAIDALARMLLAARRQGGGARVVEARRDVVELLTLVGLLGQVQRQSELLEVLDADEVVVPDDPVA